MLIYQKTRLKQKALKIPGFSDLMAFITRKTPRIFLYHRFADTSQHHQGAIHVENSRWQLQQLAQK